MKKKCLIAIGLIAVLALSACGASPSQTPSDNNDNTKTDVTVSTDADTAETDTPEEDKPEEKLTLPRPLTLENKAEFISIAEQLGEKQTYEVNGNKIDWIYVDGALVIYCDKFDWPNNTIIDIDMPCLDAKSEIRELVAADGCAPIGALFNDYCSEADNLEVIIIPEGTISMPNISDCPKLTYIYIPDSVKMIGKIHNCTALKEVVIPDGVTELIGTFHGCTALEKVNIPDSVEKLNGTFEYCESLREINLPNTIKSLGEYSFKGCKSLREVLIPEGIEYIPSTTFEDCSLTTLSIPSTLVGISETAFNRCDIQNIINNSTKFSMDNGVLVYKQDVDVYGELKEVSQIIKAQNNIESYDIHSYITQIYPYAFYGCTNLKSILLPVGISSIGSGAFENCESLVNVEQAEGYKPINMPEYGRRMFKGCKSLTEMPIYITQSDAETYYGCSGIKRVDIEGNRWVDCIAIVKQFDENNNTTDFYMHWHSGKGDYDFSQVYKNHMSDVEAINERHPGHVYLYDESVDKAILFTGRETFFIKDYTS